MAQLLNPAAAVPDPGRISQILPTVKCSNCNQPVPIHELGDHVCEPTPAMPALKSLVSPLSAIEFDPQKFQSKQPLPTQKTVQSHQPVTSHTVSGPNAHVSLTGAPVGLQTRSRAPSTSSRRSARTPEPGPSRYDNGASRHPFPTGPASPGPQRVRSPLTGNAPPMPAEVPFPTTRSPSISSRSPTPGRGYPPMVNSLQPPPRAPSTPGPRSSPPPSLVSGARPAAHSSPAPSPYASQSQPQPPVARHRTPGPPAPSQLSLPSGRSRAASSATTGGYEVIYSTGGNDNGPATASAFPPRFPSNAPDHGMQPPRARMPSTSSLPPVQPPTRTRAPSTSSVGPHPYSARAQTPSIPGSASGRPSFDRRPSNLADGYPISPPTPGPPPPPAPTPAPGAIRSPVPNIDTKTGGEAGMAGVGRRGFAAAAAAAMFAIPMNTREGTPAPLTIPNQGMDGRRSNAPKFVDVVSATQYGATPPLSPATLSPHSQKSPVSGPQSRTQPTTPTSPGPVPHVATSPNTNLSRGFSNSSQRDRHVPPPLEPPKVPLPAVPITPTTPNTPRLPFFEKFKAQQPPSESPEPVPDARPPSPPSDSDSEYGGLAYANDDDDLDDDMPSPKLPPIDTSVPAQAGPSSGGKIRFPSMASESQYSATSPTSPAMPRRTLSDSRASRGPAKSTGALDRVMETLFEEGVSPLTSPAPKTAPLAPEGQRDSVSRPPKLPVRSHTSPTLGKGAKSSSSRQKERFCAKCTKVIEDGRWIQMEGGSVLCDRCWKNMYLPKCRRCNQTIEKQAVSSSDGQLKGKYHRECFNCHKCHTPFPDKTFYVLDGKPFCAYHYHEANRSLCAAASCGQPIEGPCAVSHSGQRYHPEHLLCEHPRCTERLVEYWEVDGRMLCERHAQGAMQEAAEEDDELDDLAATTEGVRDSVAIRGMKRMTQFIDLGPSELR